MLDFDAKRAAIERVQRAVETCPPSSEQVTGEAVAPYEPWPSTSPDVITSVEAYVNALAVGGITSRSSAITRRLAYREGFLLANLGGPPGARERDALLALQRALGIESALAARIEDWMVRYSAVLEEGEALLAGG